MTGHDRWGAYVHVPWCRRRCPYCAFYVEVDRGEDQRPYVDAVLRELEARRPAFDALGPPSTLSFGGGTPSRLDPGQLARVIEALGLATNAEISLEANPEDLDPERLAALRDAGVTRLSIGMQTLDPRFARLLNRASSVREAAAAIARVADMGFASFSVDLMFALPGQTIDDLDAELDLVLAAKPPHVSLYGLTFEEGTPFRRARDAGRLTEADDDTWRAMYDRIALRLRGAGMTRYEISNYALPGHESRHNRLYWTDRPYLGLGPSAHGYAPDGARWHNVADLGAYLLAADPTAELERPDPIAAASDRLLSGLRGVDGVDTTDFARRGVELPSAATASLAAARLILAHGGRLILTDSGVAVADAIVERLSRALRVVERTR
jgi:oxygen-independent coproporphyrinogen III oxidase